MLNSDGSIHSQSRCLTFDEALLKLQARLQLTCGRAWHGIYLLYCPLLLLQASHAHAVFVMELTFATYHLMTWAALHMLLISGNCNPCAIRG